MLQRLSALFVSLAFCMVAQAPGAYFGTWTSGSSGNNGKLSLTFTETGLTSAFFTLQGETVKTTPTFTKAEGNNVQFAFDYEVDGNMLRSRMQGSVDGKTIKGKYQSLPTGGGDQVDEGIWEVTRQ